MKDKSLATAAAVAGMSKRSGRRWRKGKLPSEKKKQKRRWRTRPDPFDGVWAEVITPLLQADQDGVLSANTILEWLDRQHPGRFKATQLRTLQRRIRDWRAINGPEREVYFPQIHPPGREAQVDFTRGHRLEVTIAGEHFRHLLFEFVLSFSGWRYVEIAASETFLALKSGLQGALWELGGAPAIIRSDNLSAATHELRKSSGRDLNQPYRSLLDHYGLSSTRINTGSAHENGVVEQAHRRIKGAIAQALILRGSSDFTSRDNYLGFVRKVVARKNRLAEPKVVIEQSHLRPLPAAAIPDYVTYQAVVRKWSTIRVSNRTYTVPSRLIGSRVEARLFADHLDVYYKDQFAERLERATGDLRARVNYRHVIASLVRKPGAFARYRWREQLFPTPTFRRAYGALRGWRGQRSADHNYLRILQLAATTMEADVDRTLRQLLDQGSRFDYPAVRDLVARRTPSIPELPSLKAPDLAII